ncbi:Fimbrial protein precursor [Marinobacterium sp. xm-d-509]|nr:MULTISPECIES: prepilin-type N-terminal cleavage/methylation domain-containing protein [unclassified Marinobacterium]NRP09311.1 Fimbrial protein precursor [Marinobacterium sp. xm-g-48]NRP82158.1 Fimbrial protein precursor [Marinobacterium sp. xm-d-509]
MCKRLIFQKGVTMVEVMVTVAIIGIIAAIAIPSYQDYVDKARLNSAVEAVYNQIVLAKREAVSNNADRYANLVTDSGNWCVYVSTSAASSNTCDTSGLYVDKSKFEGVLVDVASVAIGFYMPDLRSVSTAIKFTSPSGNAKKTISTSEHHMISVGSYE